MESLHFSEEEKRETLRRAQEIAEAPKPVAPADDLQAYLDAAEEAGVPRSAMLAALQERLIVSGQPFKEGDLVLAPSADGACYPARIELLADSDATVQFISGGEHTVSLGLLRPLGIVPGR